MTASNSLKKWLKTQLEALVGVQRCTLGLTSSITAQAYAPDIVVYLWTGARVHIYILSEPHKMRLIKTALQNDSQISIGSMFIVSADILPFSEARQIFSPDEWLLAVHALTNERVYFFTADADQLLQVHFDKLGLTDTYRAIMGPPVAIHQLRYARVTIKQNAVKGFWMLAEFDADAFWKKQAQNGSYYEIPVYKRPPADERKQNPRGAPPPPPRSQGTRQNSTQDIPRLSAKLEQSYELLGLPAGASRDEVKAAFRKLAFEVHPDVSKLEKAEAEARFKALSEAYELIKATNDW